MNLRLARTCHYVLKFLVPVILLAISASWARGEDWGAYSLVPASAPAFVLEAVGSTIADGSIVSIGRPVGTPNQKWVVFPRSDNFFAIQQAANPKRERRSRRHGEFHSCNLVCEVAL